MNLRVLGCSGSIALDNRTTCFQLDERILVDAGTGVGDLTLEEMAGIDHILLSHSAASRCTACTIDVEPRRREQPSDHAPVIATLA